MIPSVPSRQMLMNWPFFHDLFNGEIDLLATILSILQSLWEYIVILINGAISLFNMALTALLLPFQAFTFLPSLLASACACFLGIAIIKTLSGGKAT